MKIRKGKIIVLNNRYMIGFCCTTMQKEPIKPVLSTLVKQAAMRDNCRLLIYHCYEDLYYDTLDNAGAAKLYDIINYDFLDVMIMMQTNEMQEPLFNSICEKCIEHGVPVISIDLYRKNVFNINFGYGEAFSQIVEHVITEHGCKDIIHMAGTKGNDFAQTRIDSCAETMARYGLTLKEENILYGDFWDNPTYAAMDAFFESGRKLPDAIICANDSMAMAVCMKLSERGYSVPRDVIVTGFDGIELEKYHDPRLTTAISDPKLIGEAAFELVDKLIADPELKNHPYDVILEYTPVFSESCGCKQRDVAKNNRVLADYVRKYNYVRGFDEDTTTMSNMVAANPTLENARHHLHKMSFGGTVLCITDEFYEYCMDTSSESDITEYSTSYPDKMYVFCERSQCDNVKEGMEFRTKDVLPDLMGSFDGNNALLVMPIHSLEIPIGLFVTYYVDSDVYFDQTYSFLMATNRSLEVVRTHERMAFLNRKLEFMFTHDQLTKICNRYGFYKKFRDDFAKIDSIEKDSFIVSVDMNDMKGINDNYGHHSGDDALKIIANSLTMAAENDSGIICARFGGDEFVVAKICKGTALEESARYRDAFAAALEALNETSGNPFKVQVSLGVYCASLKTVDSVDELIDLADHLMYNDKARYKRQPRNHK